MSKLYLGDHVRDTVHDVRGRIIGKDIFYRGSGLIDPWFRDQRPKLARATLDQDWYRLLMEDGGATYRPEESLERIDPFPLNHPHEDRYFRPG